MMQRKTPNDQGAALLSILMIVAVMSVAALAAVEALGRSLGTVASRLGRAINRGARRDCG